MNSFCYQCAFQSRINNVSYVLCLGRLSFYLLILCRYLTINIKMEHTQLLSFSCDKIQTQIWCQPYKLVDNIVCAHCCLHRNYFYVPRRPLERAGWDLDVGWKWAHHCSSLSVFLSVRLWLLWEESAVVSRIISTGSYSDSSEWFYCSNLLVFVSSFHFYHPAILCLAVNQQIFPAPSPSLTARLFQHVHISIIVLSACGCGCSSAHRQGLSVWLCGSSHGSFLLQQAN